MRYYIDCEWDGFGGPLLSMALVREDGAEWYEVISDDAKEEWVIHNVLPILNKQAVGKKRAQESLANFLCKDKELIIVIADWPEDIGKFCEMMITGPGKRLKFAERVRFEFVGGLELNSELPHNALSDAKALRSLIEG